MRIAALIGLLLTMPPAYAANVDCRNCHLMVEPGAPAPDFTDYFNNVNRNHHATGVRYPQPFDSVGEYNQPDGIAPDLVFFDANFNGQADAEEVQLFGALGNATVECSSCHIEHGTAPPVPGLAATGYLRMDNSHSALCSVCHKN